MVSVGVVFCLGAAAATPPTIVHVIADDLGYNDLGFANGGKTHTPHIDEAVRKGISLTSYHTYKVCSPTRASIMTGRYPWGVGYYDMHGPLAVPLDIKMLPALLKEQYGYETHAVGKWNLGNIVRDYTPTFRGFDSFLGYYAAALGDYWYHGGGHCTPSDGIPAPAFFTDLSNSSGAGVPEGVQPATAPGVNGTYNLDIFAADAVRRIQTHAAEQRARVLRGEEERGLYIYAAFQNVHSAAQNKASPSGNHPLHAPCYEVDKLYAKTPFDTYKVMGGMITYLDYGVGNLTAALDAAGRPYVLVLSSDNGGPLTHATNYPLRGGKHSLWEGGVRVRSFVTGPLVPQAVRGTSWGGLAHSSDWYLTFAEGIAGGNVKLPASVINATGPRAPDGFNLWPALCGNGTSPREEVIHQVVNNYTAAEGLTDAATIQVGKYKLYLGDPGFAEDLVVAWPEPAAKQVAFGQSNGTRDVYPEEKGTGAHCRAAMYEGLPGISQAGPKPVKRCAGGCLFDLDADLAEETNLYESPAHKDIVSQLSARLQAAAATGPEWAFPYGGKGPAYKALTQKNCDYTCNHTEGYVEPADTSLPPPGPGPSPGPSPAPPKECTDALKSSCPIKSFSTFDDCLKCTRDASPVTQACKPSQRQSYCHQIGM